MGEPVLCPVCGAEAVLLVAGQCIGCPGPKKVRKPEATKKHCHYCGEDWVQMPNNSTRCWHCRMDNSE